MASSVTKNLSAEPVCDPAQPNQSTGGATAAEHLPPLTSIEFNTYNRMAEIMNLFHNNFRREWKRLYAACDSSLFSSPDEHPVPASSVIAAGLAFISHLTMHHDIEEQHIFPLLGERMPAFQHHSSATTDDDCDEADNDNNNEDSDSDSIPRGPIKQHRAIHAGLDELGEYLHACKTGEKDFQRSEVKRIMDGFGGVLLHHLEEEVYELGAERMRKYWSLDEMKRMPM